MLEMMQSVFDSSAQVGGQSVHSRAARSTSDDKGGAKDDDCPDDDVLSVQSVDSESALKLAIKAKRAARKLPKAAAKPKARAKPKAGATPKAAAKAAPPPALEPPLPPPAQAPPPPEPIVPRPPRAARAEAAGRGDRVAFSWGGFTFSRLVDPTTEVQYGWGCSCRLHWDVSSKLDCKKNLRYGQGANRLDDDSAVRQLKRWILRGFSIPRSATARSDHVLRVDIRSLGPQVLPGQNHEDLVSDPVIPEALVPLPGGRR